MIEKIFRIIKQHFQIFKSAPRCYYNIQISFIFAIIVLYNFIYIYQSKKDIYDKKQEKLEKKTR